MQGSSVRSVYITESLLFGPAHGIALIPLNNQCFHGLFLCALNTDLKNMSEGNGCCKHLIKQRNKILI